jgi:hypothetical protein
MIGAGGHRPGGVDVYDEIALDEAPAGVGVVPWVKRAVIGVGVVAFLVLSGHYLLLDHTATRGDVPDAADMRFPAGAVVVATEKHCRGEACWSTFYVAPPPGMTATELKDLVDGIPGVAHIYQPRATLPALLAARKTPDPTTPPPPPRVEIGDDGVIALTIATDADSLSPDVAHRIHDTLMARLDEAGIMATRIDVRIARVD